MSQRFELRCKACGKTWGNIPKSYCEDCFSPLEVSYDYEFMKQNARRENLAGREFTMWRYAELLPLPEGFQPAAPIGGTPLVEARKLAARWGISKLYLKNDAVCFPSLSFKDRVVATALVAARRFGLETVGCSSTGNLANAVAAQAAQQGFEACVFIPADLEPAKILNAAVYGARIVRIQGNYDHVSRLCTQIADRYPWGLVNVNLRPYYSEGSKTHGFEVAEQLGWRLPDNIVVPMAGGALITKISKSFGELTELGWVEPHPTRFFGAQASGCSPITTAAKQGTREIQPQKPRTIAKSLAIGNPADGPYAVKAILDSGGAGEDVTDDELVEGIRLLAETEGIFTETAGGVTVAVAKKLINAGRIDPDESLVLVITGNGLKTLGAVSGRMGPCISIRPKLEEFEEQFLAVA